MKHVNKYFKDLKFRGHSVNHSEVIDKPKLRWRNLQSVRLTPIRELWTKNPQLLEFLNFWLSQRGVH